MLAKRLFVLVVALIFALGAVSLAFADEVSGKITKMEGNKLTIKAGDKEVTVDVKDAKGLKVGDDVTVKEGVAKKKKAAVGC